MNGKYDIEKIKSLLSQCKWTWAKTYISVPHEYIVREKCGLSDDDFLYIVAAQRELGTPERWGKYNFPYLYLDGYKYWTMGNDFDVTKIINRQKVFSEFDTLDRIISICEEDEKKYITNVILSTFDKPIFEVGFGDGWLIKYANLPPSKWYGVEPSKKCVSYVRDSYKGFYKRVANCSFEESIDKWIASDSVVVALFGTASYLMGQYLKLLKESGKDYFLMFYKYRYCPEQFASMHHFSYTKEGLERSFGLEVVEFGNYYIVSSKRIQKIPSQENYIQAKLF